METINKIKSKKYCPVHTLKVPFLEVKWLKLGEIVKKKRKESDTFKVNISLSYTKKNENYKLNKCLLNKSNVLRNKKHILMALFFCPLYRV